MSGKPNAVRTCAVNNCILYSDRDMIYILFRGTGFLNLLTYKVLGGFASGCRWLRILAIHPCLMDWVSLATHQALENTWLFIRREHLFYYFLDKETKAQWEGHDLLMVLCIVHTWVTVTRLYFLYSKRIYSYCLLRVLKLILSINCFVYLGHFFYSLKL